MKMDYIKICREIIDKNQHQKVDGFLIDTTTARAIVIVYDRLSQENKHTFIGFPIDKMASVAWKLIAKGGF